MNFPDFLALADGALRSSVGDAGFRRTGGGRWNRRVGDEFHVIQLQRRSSEPLFCVNLGIHYAFLEKSGSVELHSGNTLDETECRIRHRLTSDPEAADQWWPLTEQGIREANDALLRRGLALFDSYSLSGSIRGIRVEEIEAGAPGLLSRLTKAGACLLLAGLHDHFGDRERCVRAAECGLRHAGTAVGVRKALKDILKRHDRPA